MAEKQIYVTIGHEGRGDDYYNEVIYVGTDLEAASERDYLQEAGYRKVEIQTWKAGIHIRTVDTDRDRRYTDWTWEFDLETKLKAEQDKVLARADEIKRKLTIIREGGEAS